MGIKDKRTNDGYELLGTMGPAVTATKIFNTPTSQNLKIREQIRRALQPALTAPRESFADAAVGFIRDVAAIDHFSGGIATRLLALARPDLAVSVNGGSRKSLSRLSGLPRNALANAPNGPRAKSYADLLRFLQQQSWYRDPTPRTAHEETLANARGALLDCLVYQSTT